MSCVTWVLGKPLSCLSSLTLFLYVSTADRLCLVLEELRIWEFHSLPTLSLLGCLAFLVVTLATLCKALSILCGSINLSSHWYPAGCLADVRAAKLPPASDLLSLSPFIAVRVYDAYIRPLAISIWSLQNLCLWLSELFLPSLPPSPLFPLSSLSPALSS